MSSARKSPEATARWTALFSPAKEKCGSPEPTSGRGSGTAVGSPSLRELFDGRSSRVAEPEQLGSLVERLARRIVDRRREAPVVADAAHFEQLAVPARDEQQQIGKAKIRIDQPRAERVALQMVDAISGLPAASASPLPASSATITPPMRPGPAVAAIASTSRTAIFASARAAFESGRAGSRRGRARQFPAPRLHRADAPAFARRPPARGCAGRFVTNATALSSQEDSKPRITVISRPALCLILSSCTRGAACRDFASGLADRRWRWRKRARWLPRSRRRSAGQTAGSRSSRSRRPATR